VPLIELLLGNLKTQSFKEIWESAHFRPLPRNNALAESLGLIKGRARVVGFAGELEQKPNRLMA